MFSYRIGDIPTRFVFESALELINETKVRDFQIAGNSQGGMRMNVNL
jgi:hypothetical protein